MNKMGDRIINFENFQIQKSMLKHLKRKKYMIKWGHLSSFIISFLSYGPEIV